MYSSWNFETRGIDWIEVDKHLISGETIYVTRIRDIGGVATLMLSKRDALRIYGALYDALKDALESDKPSTEAEWPKCDVCGERVYLKRFNPSLDRHYYMHRLADGTYSVFATDDPGTADHFARVDRVDRVDGDFADAHTEWVVS